MKERKDPFPKRCACRQAVCRPEERDTCRRFKDDMIVWNAVPDFVKKEHRFCQLSPGALWMASHLEIEGAGTARQTQVTEVLIPRWRS